jgi:DNA helicase HerA-like ATPase
VGIYFVTQNPADVPDKILSQLGNRVQHALRAFSVRDQKAVRAAAETMRDNPELDEQAAITELGVGEALISMLNEKGTPTIVERAWIVPPQAHIGPINETERKAIIESSLLAGHYEQAIDRESAYEMIKGRAQEKQAAETQAAPAAQNSGGGLGGMLGGIFGGGDNRRQSAGEALVKTVVRTVGAELGRQLVRGVMGSLMGGSTSTRSRRR